MYSCAKNTTTVISFLHSIESSKKDETYREKKERANERRYKRQHHFRNWLQKYQTPQKINDNDNDDDSNRHRRSDQQQPSRTKRKEKQTSEIIYFILNLLRVSENWTDKSKAYFVAISLRCKRRFTCWRVRVRARQTATTRDRNADTLIAV